MTGDLFRCAACQRDVKIPWYGGWDARAREIAPICQSCENDYTVTSIYPRDRRVRPPTGGHFRDRREAMRLYAMADCLHCEALRLQWSANR